MMKGTLEECLNLLIACKQAIVDEIKCDSPETNEIFSKLVPDVDQLIRVLQRDNRIGHISLAIPNEKMVKIESGELETMDSLTNRQRLASCCGHNFRGVECGGRIVEYRCTKCDGRVSTEAAKWYQLGLKDGAVPRSTSRSSSKKVEFPLLLPGMRIVYGSGPLNLLGEGRVLAASENGWICTTDADGKNWVTLFNARNI